MRIRSILIALFSFALCASLSSCTEEVFAGYEGEQLVRDTLYISGLPVDQVISLEEFGLSPEKSASENKVALQAAIDWASPRGAALYLPPSENGYPCDGGIVLKKNVSIYGSHVPSAKGSVNKAGNAPTGSMFVITDETNVFMTLEFASRLEGLQFYYPEQTRTSVAFIKQYKPTLKLSSESNAVGVTLRNLSFYGEYVTMDFLSSSCPCEQIYIENCYGFPLSCIFVEISYCYDVPRLIGLHMTRHNQEAFGGFYSEEILNYVSNTGNSAYWFNNIDNLVMMDINTDCAYEALYLGGNTYGQLTQFRFDNVRSGIRRKGPTWYRFNSTWMIAQGSISATAGKAGDELHPLTVSGYGFTSFTGVESHAGEVNGVWTAGESMDFLNVPLTYKTDVSLLNCNMKAYSSDSPITVGSANAQIRASQCFAKDGSIYEFKYPQ